MKRPDTRIALVAWAVVALIAIGCGDEATDDSGPSAEDESEITTVLETIFTTSDPKQCTELTTPAAVRQALPSAKENDLVASCKKSLEPSAEADSIEVAEIAVDGTEATAVVTPDGGSLAGATADAALVNEGGWKFDGFTALHIDDRDEYIGEIEARLSDQGIAGTGLSRGATDCIGTHIDEEVSNNAFERFVVDADRGFLYDAVRLCLGGGLDLTAITLIVRKQFIEEGLSKREANCLAGVGIAGLKDVTLEDFAEDPKVQARYTDAIKSGAFLCRA